MHVNIYGFRKSYRSRKKARKQARKILCVKEGGMFEDVGLIFELYKIIDDMYKDRGLFRSSVILTPLCVITICRRVADICYVPYLSFLQTKRPNLCTY